MCTVAEGLRAATRAASGTTQVGRTRYKIDQLSGGQNLRVRKVQAKQSHLVAAGDDTKKSLLHLLDPPWNSKQSVNAPSTTPTSSNAQAGGQLQNLVTELKKRETPITPEDIEQLIEETTTPVITSKNVHSAVSRVNQARAKLQTAQQARQKLHEMERFRGGLQQQGPGLGGKGDLKELHSKQDKAVLESATEVISDGEDDGMKIETAGVIKQGIDSVVTNLENIRVRPAEASKEESAAAKKARIGDSGKASAALQPFARPGNSDLKEICPRPIHNLCFQDHFDLICKVFTVSLDIIIDAEFGDVSRKPVRDFWLHGIRERAVIGLLAGPPCETWSQARGKTLNFSSISLQRRAPRIVRDRDCLCGRAALALRELEQLHIGNLLLLFTIEMLIHLAVQGGVGAMEHPAPPKDSSLASVWHLFVLQYLCKWPEFLRIELAQGLWGAMSLKPTALLLLNLPAMPKILRG